MDAHIESGLAPYAISAEQTRGRRLVEAPPAWRSEFQRDRDRVIHCSAFRRLEYKTQVFVNHEGDMFRTRLTHSLEVAQIARSVARALGVNEDLTEAIALAHDLGHTPFGHAGQTALNACMRPYGGFEHNLQSLRVVDQLERRYPDFDGLNLLFETREGILKHCPLGKAAQLGDLGERFVRGQQASVEAQIANLADEIAYNHHDIDDGLRSGILTLDDLELHAEFRRALATAAGRVQEADGRRMIYTAIRTMLGTFVNDLINTSRERLALQPFGCVDDIRQQAEPVIRFSAAMQGSHIALKRLLHRGLYNNPRVRVFTDAAADTVKDLFHIYVDTPSTLSDAVDRRTLDDPQARARGIADYIAGMTDRFAIAEHRRLLGSDRWPADTPGR